MFTNPQIKESHKISNFDNFTVMLFVGARPNIPKAWTMQRALKKLVEEKGRSVDYYIIHSGQHYSRNLGADYAEQLGVRIDYNLKVGSGNSDGHQLSSLSSECDKIIDKKQPRIVVVIGDVNTSVAAALVASRRGIPVIHLEAGLRSFALNPEEINRKVISACSDYHLAPSEQAVINLQNEGIPRGQIYLVGNSMAEALIYYKKDRDNSQITEKLKVEIKNYILMTIHKPVNITNKELVLDLISKITKNQFVVFPCHPRVKKLLSKNLFRIKNQDNLLMLQPQPYVDFGCLMQNAEHIITDSGGVQEESTMIGIPCITFGIKTARPETILYGTNVEVGNSISLCLEHLQNPKKKGRIPPFWDDNVSDRISEAMVDILSNNNYTYKKWSIRPQ